MLIEKEQRQDQAKTCIPDYQENGAAAHRGVMAAPKPLRGPGGRRGNMPLGPAA